MCRAYGASRFGMIFTQGAKSLRSELAPWATIFRAYGAALWLDSRMYRSDRELFKIRSNVAHSSSISTKIASATIK